MKVRGYNSSLSQDTEKGLRRSKSLNRGKLSTPDKKKSATTRRRPISPASPSQRAKVKGMCCLVCGQEPSERVTVDPAHLWPRGRGGCDSELCVVPLCRTFDGGCHRLLDDGKLDVLPFLAGRFTAELCHALEHAEGNLLGLLQRLTGERFVPESLVADRSSWDNGRATEMGGHRANGPAPDTER